MSKYPTHTLDKDSPSETEYEITEEGELIVRPHRAPNMSTLSERMRGLSPISMQSMDGPQLLEGLADEVATLEAELAECKYGLGVLEASRALEDEAKNKADDRIAHLNKNYERLGMSSALVVENKYGRRSAFGYQRD